MLDLRLPIGMFFCINAVVLVVAGMMQPVASQVGDLIVNLNLVWGLVMAGFGLLMLGLSFMDKKAKP